MFALTGKTIGPYRILEQIGHGGMAMVYKAYQPSMDRYVAIKVLSPNLSQDAEFVKRFQREARAIAKLEHGHILPVHDYGEHEGVTYIAMRYVEAGTLRDRITAGQLPLTEINRIIGQIGGALEYAHRMGVVHRDVKPGNVLLNDQGETYLTDFGLARMMEPIEKLTASGVGLGTPAYMSPEQGRGDKVDDRSDIYSLGVILYEMVTGRVPFEAETPMAVVLKHINEPLSLPHTIKPDVPEPIERVILKAMAKDPADRFQTAGEMVQALAIATRTANAEPDREFVPVLNSSTPARDDVSLVTRLQRAWAQPRGKVMLAGGGLVVSVVVVALGFLLNWLLPTPVDIIPQGELMTATTIVQVASTPTATVVRPTQTAISTRTPAPTATPILPGAVLYEEDFEDGILQDAVLTSEITRWQIVKDETGNMVHRIDNRDGPNFAWMEFGSEEWKDYAVEFRMRILTPESDRWGVVMHFRNDTIGNSYILDISPEIPSSGVMQLAMTLNNNPWVILKSENTKNTADIWHTVRQEVDQDQMRTYFDGQLVIDVTDSQIQQGAIALGAGPGAYVEFDDIRVISLGTTTASTLAPQAEQARAFAEPILQTIAERTPDVVDDFSFDNDNWDLGYGENLAHIEQGVLRLTAADATNDEWAGAYHSRMNADDFVFQFDARATAMEFDSHLSIAWRWLRSDNSSYWLTIFPSLNGAWTLGGAGNDFFEVANGNSDSVRLDDWFNVTLIAKGSRFAVLLNDQPLYYFEDDRRPIGRTVLGMNISTGDAIAEFDNVKYWDISDLP